MIAQFEVISDATKWLVDTEALTWAHIADNPEESSAGELRVAGSNIYSLSPRVPTTEGPGAGLCTVLIVPLPVGQTLWLYLKANVPTRNFTMPKPITQIRYQIIGDVNAPKP